MAATAFMFLALLVLPGVLGIVLIFTARKEGSAYPACGSCRYDVSGSVGSTTRCPECGAEFLQAGIIPPGRRWNKALLWLGVAFTLLPITCIGTAGGVHLIASRQAVAARQAAAQAQQQATTAQQSAMSSTQPSTQPPAAPPEQDE